MGLIPETKDCLIIGDFNICSNKHPDKFLSDSLKSRGFMLITNEATHLRGGHIDQAWLRRREKNYEIKMYSPYYTCKDHDALLFTLYSPIIEKGMFERTALAQTHCKFTDIERDKQQMRGVSITREKKPKGKQNLINTPFKQIFQIGS